MRKNISFVVCMVLLLAACRKEADYIPYTGENSKLAYSTYTEQFQYLWKCMSTGYVFWDVDTVDWDASYDRYLPKFEDIDKKYQDSGFVRTTELEKLYTGLVGKMCDHHMTFMVKNLHPAPGEVYQYVIVRPGLSEVMARDYYIENRSAAQTGLRTFLNGIEEQYTVAEHLAANAYIPEFGTNVHYEYCLFTLDDGRQVPYLWTSNAAITPVMRDMVGDPAQVLLDRWLSNVCSTPRSQLAGFILDTRSNGGGYQDDLDYLVGSFINERMEIFKTRYKEGPGRLEYSVWCPYYQNPNQNYHRDITAEKIPYVVITDVNSVSMAEIEPMVIKDVFPTAYIVGERTYGGTGPLQNDAEDLNYGAPFGNSSEYCHYVYTSTFEALMCGEVLEGIGISPDEEVLRKNAPAHSFKPQLDAALAYIQKH
ncbi:MAG: hypothetical protein J6W88_01410 [Bacteroidales bacterium]|nr:hypothetical protein [Bacteroidales bacterium]